MDLHQARESTLVRLLGEPNFINNAYDYGADRASWCYLLLNVASKNTDLQVLHIVRYIYGTYGYSLIPYKYKTQYVIWLHKIMTNIAKLVKHAN